jgi:hypothetical protein
LKKVVEDPADPLRALRPPKDSGVCRGAADSANGAVLIELLMAMEVALELERS